MGFETLCQLAPAIISSTDNVKVPGRIGPTVKADGPFIGIIGITVRFGRPDEIECSVVPFGLPCCLDENVLRRLSLWR